MASGNINSRAALLSGAPGIGKTSTVRLLGQELGYEVREYNASSVRSKNSIRDSVAYLAGNSLLNQKPFVILMDEVDGMSAGDRGGNAAVIEVIKKTQVPIICICNDRGSQKIRSLAGHCYDLKFAKPMKQQVGRGIQKTLMKVPYECQ